MATYITTANEYRKNMLAAWNWGTLFYEDFPQITAPFASVQSFPAQEKERYVPPEEDVIKVLQMAEGQDLILLLTLYFTGARRSEAFKLSWDKDVRLDERKIRLTDNKTGKGKLRTRWLDIHPELVKALAWWRENRPCKVDNIFMQTHCETAFGKPFLQRNKFMNRLCERAGVKPFGFHALRHKSAAITFVGGGLHAAKVLMGHYRASTTDRYVASAGLYAGQDVILTALGESEIGKAVGDLMQKNLLCESTRRGDCNRDDVTRVIQ